MPQLKGVIPSIEANGISYANDLNKLNDVRLRKRVGALGAAGFLLSKDAIDSATLYAQGED
jgi:hypothetical protein